MLESHESWSSRRRSFWKWSDIVLHWCYSSLQFKYAHRLWVFQQPLIHHSMLETPKQLYRVASSLLLSSAQDGSMGLKPGQPAIAIIITDGLSNINRGQTISNALSVHASNIFQQVYALVMLTSMSLMLLLMILHLFLIQIVLTVQLFNNCSKVLPMQKLCDGKLIVV